MTLLRAALEATLTNRPFVEDELLSALPAGTRPPAGTPIALRLIDLEDRDEVTAEVRTVENSTLLLHGFAEEKDAEHTFRVMEELCDAGFDEGSRYRVFRPLALMADDCLVVSSGRTGTSVAELVDRRAPEAIGMIKEAGAWLGELHSADVRVGQPWWPWRSIDAVGTGLRARFHEFGDHGDELRGMVQRLAPLAVNASEWTWTQTHGRFRPDRVMSDHGSVTVDDFVRSVPGDPARDVAEFIVHVRRRAILEGDPRATAFEPAFLDGYLAHAPAEHLVNLGFYAGCVVLASLVSEAPTALEDWLDFHLSEFARFVPPSVGVLQTPA